MTPPRASSPEPDRRQTLARPVAPTPFDPSPGRRRRRRAARCAALLPALAALTLAGGIPGCGYTLSSVLPAHIKSIAIPTFANNTVEHGLADDITQSLIDGFLADKKLRLERERDADSVLRGTVLAYRNRVYAYDPNEVATQYEIVLIVQVTYRDVVRNRDLWKENEMIVRTTYHVVPVGEAPAQTEVEGRSDVIQKLTDLVVSRTIQGW
jgi:outer membrane lipopolysaccharide assembly protein LptE/RlpB